MEAPKEPTLGHKAGWNDDKLFDVAEIDLEGMSGDPVIPDGDHVVLYAKGGQIYRINSAGVVRNLEDTSTSDAIGFPFELLPLTESWTIATNRQAILKDDFELQGELILEGSLVII